MRILFIAPRFHSNQIALIKKLKEEGHKVEFFVVAKGHSESYQTLIPKVIPISRLTEYCLKYTKRGSVIDFPKYSVIAIPKVFPFFKMINEFNPEVIILRGASAPRYSWFSILYAIFKGIKIVFYTQGPKYVERVRPIRKIHDWFFTQILKFRWYTPVLHRTNEYHSKLNLQHIYYIPFFVYPQKSPSEIKPSTNTINFISIGKFEPRKNIKLLIEVFSRIREEKINFRLTIIGSTGTNEREQHFLEVEQLIKQLELDNYITLYKNVPYDEMQNHYNSHQIMILPSINEPASISQLEAMSYGLAIICSEDNGTAHYVANNRNGFIIKATEEELYNSLIHYLKNPQDIIKHGQESIKMISEDFSINKSYENLLAILIK